LFNVVAQARTAAGELQLAFRYFGYDMALHSDLRSNPPTLATWQRERKDMEAAYAKCALAFGGSPSQAAHFRFGEVKQT
jgi:hypothetical protein